MTGMMTGSARVRLFILSGAILIIGTDSDAVAKGHKTPWHAHSLMSEARGREAARRPQLVLQQPVRLGPMRYYGGPKSPMWRGPVEN
jgi:hypothetical protein